VIRTPADLAGVPVSVGYQSGSHYATIQALESYLAKDQIRLSFDEGMLFARMEAFFEGKSQAATLFGGPYYFAEQLGYRKIIDTTFMIGAMVNGDPDMDDVRRYFQALRRAQRDIDLRPELFTHYYRKEFPERFTQRWIRGAGDRASASCSNPTAARYSRSPSTGSPATKSSKPAAWVAVTTRSRRCRWDSETARA
jgi:hypothetical protein